MSRLGQIVCALGACAWSCSSVGTVLERKITSIEPGPVGGPACGLAQAAFCETFDQNQDGGRGAGIDETRWSFSRWGQTASDWFNRPSSSSNPPGVTQSDIPTFCGQTFLQIDDPNDAEVCLGSDGAGMPSMQLNEVLTDWGDGVNAMRIRQPFDFTGRTGTLVFDVDAKKNNGWNERGFWIQLWITQDPEPLPYQHENITAAYPRAGVGFVIRPFTGACKVDGKNEVGQTQIYKDHRGTMGFSGGTACFNATDGVLNRFKVLISQSHAEIWVSDPNTGTSNLAFQTDWDLGFSMGYVHLEHAQFAAASSGASAAQTYRWDNVGFDGPTYPMPRGYDVPDALTNVYDQNVVAKAIGYPLDSPKTFTLYGVDLTHAAGATFNFDTVTEAGRSLRYRFNEREWHVFTAPSSDPQYDGAPELRCYSVPVSLSELVQGNNILDLENIDEGAQTSIGNMDLTIDPYE